MSGALYDSRTKGFLMRTENMLIGLLKLPSLILVFPEHTHHFVGFA